MGQLMTLQERLTEAHAKAAKLYLQRQSIELQRATFAQQATLVDRALLKSDGEIEALEALIASEKGVPDGL